MYKCKSSAKGLVFLLKRVRWGWERLECVSWLRTRIQFWASGRGDIGKRRDDEGARMDGRLGSKHQLEGGTSLEEEEGLTSSERRRKEVNSFCGVANRKDSGKGNRYQRDFLVRRVEAWGCRRNIGMEGGEDWKSGI